MKKILLASILLSLFSISCKKNSDTKITVPEKKHTTLGEVKKALMENIIHLAKAVPEFRKTVETECLKQARGDYNVALEKIIEINERTQFLSSNQTSLFISLVQEMKSFRPNELPIIFVPVMESRDPKEKINKKNTQQSNNLNSNITMVDQGDDIDKIMKPANNNGDEIPLRAEENPCYSGYIISDGGTLTYSTCITESLAYSTDVWVLGYEEVVSPGNMIASSFDGYNGGYVGGGGLIINRMQGRTEYGGRIQVTSLPSIENWRRGKPEFKHFVYSSTGTLIHEHAYGKLKRSHFNGDNWISLRCTIGNWNTSAWGDITYERWIEEDGGSSSSLTQNISYTQNGVTYTATITTPAKSNDNNLGYTNIQFTDPTAWQPPMLPGTYSTFKYTYTDMNMQREDY